MFSGSNTTRCIQGRVGSKVKIKIDRDIDQLGLNHQRKLIHLSEEQGKLLWETNKKAYTLVDLVDTPPDFALNAISKGPRHPVRKKFDKPGFFS